MCMYMYHCLTHPFLVLHIIMLFLLGVREGEIIESESSLCKSISAGVGEIGTPESKVTSFTGSGSVGSGVGDLVTLELRVTSFKGCDMGADGWSSCRGSELTFEPTTKIEPGFFLAERTGVFFFPLCGLQTGVVFSFP